MFTNSEYTVREIRTRSGAGVATAVLRRLAAGARRFGDEALAAGRRSRQRARLWRELQRLDDRQFRDIGRTRAELEAEAAKPFWRR